MWSTPRILRFLTLTSLCVTTPYGLAANKLTTTLSLDTSYTNNSRLRPSNEAQDDILLVPGISTNYLFEYPDLTASLNYTATRTHYVNNTYADRTDVLGQGSFNWAIIDQRLFWNFSDTRTRLTINSADNPTPNNQANRDVIRTGPTLQFNLGPTRQVSMSANYVRSSFNTAGLFKSHQAQYQAQYLQNIGVHGARAGLTGMYSRSYSDVSILRYNLKRYGLTASNTQQRFQYNLTVGRNTVERENSRSSSGIYYSLSASLVAQSSTFSISLNRELTDSAIGLSLNRLMTSVPGASTADSLPTDIYGNPSLTDIIDSHHYQLAYGYQEARFSLLARLFYDRQDYLTLPRDRSRRGGAITLGYKFSPITSVSYDFSASTQDYQTGDLSGTKGKRNARIHRLSLRYTPNTRIGASIWISRRVGDYRLGDSNYTEFEGGFSIRYEL